MNDMNPNVPQATSKRLPIYYRILRKFQHDGVTRISSGDLSKAMKIDAATIRRDFSHFGALGRKGYGYNVDELVTFFSKVLQQDEETDVALVGVGSLGGAILKYNFQKNHNIRVVVAFDPKAPHEGRKFNDIDLYHPDEIESQLRARDVRVVILTVPSKVAQEVTDRLVAAGTKGILNFTPVRLSVPSDVRIHTIDLSVELQTLIYFLRNDEQAEEKGNEVE